MLSELIFSFLELSMFKSISLIFALIYTISFAQKHQIINLSVAKFIYPCKLRVQKLNTKNELEFLNIERIQHLIFLRVG